MAIYGKIKNFRIVSLENEIIAANEPALNSYIRQKHKTAEDNGRYVVKFYVDDPRFPDHLQKVNAFIPKSIIDNNLIEKETNINCSDTSCHFEILGINDWFDRAMNGDTQIRDGKKIS